MTIYDQVSKALLSEAYERALAFCEVGRLDSVPYSVWDRLTPKQHRELEAINNARAYLLGGGP